MKIYILTGLMTALFMMTACENKTEGVRQLPLEGAYNVRDMGGYKTADNKTVKWRKVFRSGDLNHLTEADLAYLAAIPLKTTIDFRDSAEIAAAPDRKPASVLAQYFLPINTGSVIDYTKVSDSLAPTLLVEGNKTFVRDNQDVYRKFFQLLMNGDNIPLLFHCSAGKDRAGYAAALFLSSLGVDRETIIEDYLLTNEYLQDKYAAMIDSLPVLKPLMMAKREYIQAALDEIDQKYGGMENYLTDYLKVDLAKMKALYTE